MFILTTTTTNSLFCTTTWVGWHQKGKPIWILREQEMMGSSGISCTICKSFAPRSRQITTLVPHQSVFTGQMHILPPNQQCQSTEGIDMFILNFVFMNVKLMASTTWWFSHRQDNCPVKSNTPHAESAV